MKSIFTTIISLFFFVSLFSTAGVTLSYAAEYQCSDPPLDSESWTVSWTDDFNETTYTLSAPCKSYINKEFDIVATATDSSVKDAEVAVTWAILDDEEVIAGGGWNILYVDEEGFWSWTKTMKYEGTPSDHKIEFKVIDEGHGAGAHFWRATMVGYVDIDPDPFGYTNSPPVVDLGRDLRLSFGELSSYVVSASATDPDNDALSCRWLLGSMELSEPALVEVEGTVSLDLTGLEAFVGEGGEHKLTLEVFDGIATSHDEIILTITD